MPSEAKSKSSVSGPRSSASALIGESAATQLPSRNACLKQQAQQIKPTELLTKAQCEAALRAFTELAALDMSDVAAHNGRGDCLRMMEDVAGKSHTRLPTASS